MTHPDPQAERLRALLLDQANERFPAVAKTDPGYPVRFNHCFLRIVYDNLFGAHWQRVLPEGQRPAYRHLSREQLARAVALGEEIIADPARCRELNRRSLAWRGKL